VPTQRTYSAARRAYTRIVPARRGGKDALARSARAFLRLVGAGLVVSTLALAAPVNGSRDSDGDGYPDGLELIGNDRAAFADWFAAIAESQFYGLHPDWAIEDQDCAGLLRFAFRGALERHDQAWLAGFRYLPQPSHGEVRAYGFPAPLVSRSLFRVAPGPYAEGDVEAGLMVGRTGAKYLANYSSRLVGRDWRAAVRGDLLFFLRPGLGSYHSMVYLGGGKVVYHTGASPADRGEVRLVTINTLMRHPDRAFHPSIANRSFLGVYRWKILDSAPASNTGAP
jgi:uncharacterized protein YfaT (DUF1175 family)